MQRSFLTGGEKNLVFSNKRNPIAIQNVANMKMVYNKAVFGFSSLPSCVVAFVMTLNSYSFRKGCCSKTYKRYVYVNDVYTND